MNVVLRKMAFLEKEMQAKEEEARLYGVTNTVDNDLRERVTRLMEKVRMI